MLKAILFDLDDTLIDWSRFTDGWDKMEANHLQNVCRYLTSLHPLPDTRVYIEEYVRRTRDAWVEGRNSLRAPHLGRLLVDTAVAVGVPVDKIDMQACLDAYAWKSVNNTRLFPEVIEMLTHFQQQGLMLGIITNSFHPMSLRDQELRDYGILEFFPDCRITAADAGYLKPHPEIFDFALKKLGISADEAVYVGDNPVADIAGAQGAGLMAVLRRKIDRLPATSGLVIPDASIASLTELPDVLSKLFAEQYQS